MEKEMNRKFSSFFLFFVCDILVNYMWRLITFYRFVCDFDELFVKILFKCFVSMEYFDEFYVNVLFSCFVCDSDELQYCMWKFFSHALYVIFRKKVCEYSGIDQIARK